MATQVLERPIPRPKKRARERVFFGGMTLLMIGTILLGFRATYFPLGPKPEAVHSGVIVLHGVVYTVFLLFLFVQVALVSARRIKWHMTLGLWVYGLSALMVPLGVVAAADEMRRELVSGVEFLPGVDTLTFSTISVLGIAVFGVLMGWSYVVRRKPDAHKRLALYAVISMMNAGIDRWPWQGWRVNETWAAWVYVGFVLLPVVYDLVTLRRVHRVAMVAVPLILLVDQYKFVVGHTATWHAVAKAMVKYLT
jgi:hypothetical protein